MLQRALKIDFANQLVCSQLLRIAQLIIHPSYSVIPLLNGTASSSSLMNWVVDQSPQSLKRQLPRERSLERCSVLLDRFLLLLTGFFPEFSPFFYTHQILFLSVFVCRGFFAFFQPFTTIFWLLLSTRISKSDLNLRFQWKYIPGCNSQYSLSCMRHQVWHSCFLEKSARKGRKQPRKTKNAIIVAMVTHPQIFTSCK